MGAGCVVKDIAATTVGSRNEPQQQADRAFSPRQRDRNAAIEFFVDSVHGSDSAAGTEAHPFRTVSAL